MSERSTFSHMARPNGNAPMAFHTIPTVDPFRWDLQFSLDRQPGLRRDIPDGESREKRGS